jgi:DNA-binding LacI/PurR family transcriptional regulator
MGKREEREPASRRPTSQDVADLAGVSRTTVSFVINRKTGGDIRISDETRAKVWEAVETLGYQPSSAGRTLRTQRSGILAVMIPRIEDLFFARFVASVQDKAEKNGLDVLIYDSRNEPER